MVFLLWVMTMNITHNKKTMEIGDLLYGVTMENPGISKTVSVQFQEAQKLVA